MCKITNQKLVENNALVGSIYTKILDENNKNILDAYNDACVWISELKLQIDNLNKSISSGFVRTDTSKLNWKSKMAVTPVDAGDALIRTGVSDDG